MKDIHIQKCYFIKIFTITQIQTTMKKMQTQSQQLFVVVGFSNTAEEKKSFVHYVCPQCNYHIFAQYDIFISCKCHFGGYS